MDILMSETCWAHNKWIKIASDIKLVFHLSTIVILFNFSIVVCVSAPLTARGSNISWFTMHDANVEVGACWCWRGIWSLQTVFEWDTFGGREIAKNVTSAANIISNNLGWGDFIPQIIKIKAYCSHEGPLSISLIFSFAMTSNKSFRAPLVLWTIVSSSYFRNDQVYNALKGGRIHKNFRVYVTDIRYQGNLIFVVPCIVILGWRNPKRCNSMQIFIYC